MAQEGIEYEADQRHAEIIVNSVGLEKESKGVVTPGCKREWNPEEGRELSPKEATAYRAAVASGNYVSQDRTDIQYAAKELSKYVVAHRRRLGVA